MTNTLVIGIGSYYGKDSIAFEVLDSLQTQLPGRNDIVFFTSNAPQELLVLVEQHKNQNIKNLIILDALEPAQAVRDITQLTLNELQNTGTALSDHYVSLYEVLKILQILYFPGLKIKIVGLSSTITLQSITQLKEIILSV